MNPPAKYRQLIFEAYNFDTVSKTLSLHYSLDSELVFTETYRFDFPFATYDPAILDRACQLLFFMCGVSYYKTYIPPEIVVRKGEIDPSTAAFLDKTYQRGLGEFWFINQLDPQTLINFPVNVRSIQAASDGALSQGILLAIGGGKDSLVSAEILRPHAPDMVTWSVGHRPQLTPLVERIGLPHCWVERTWDRKLLELDKRDALNGHIPISAIFACVGLVTAVLSGKRDIVVSNEQSANEPDFVYKSVEINHQYSKSQQFEKDFQELLTHLFGDEYRYYSFLRPLSEVHIAQIFAQNGFDKYKDVFSSCNRAFIHTSNRISWCGACPKCAFTALALTPFLERSKLEALWNGKNPLLNPALEAIYRQLLGIEGGKPLDCVGEIKESRTAMRLAQEKYPELKEKYQFELPEGYNYQRLASHHMPSEIYNYLISAVQQPGGQPE